jgi:hypothetical protein
MIAVIGDILTFMYLSPLVQRVGAAPIPWIHVEQDEQ